MKQPLVLIISGPTAVGKSALAESIANLISGEIVNGDMGQCYTPLSIGTAKPNLAQVTVPHHLFNIVDEPRDLTVVEYSQRVQNIVQDIWQRNKIPVIVGGSSFYLASLFFPPHYAHAQTQAVPSTEIQEVDSEKLWAELYSVDPERALSIGRSDVYRLKRALEIWRTTGTKPSAYAPIYNPIFPHYRFIFCTRDREELNQRINKRVKEMAREGWIDEVQQLRGTAWESFLYRKKIIGYSDILVFLHNQDHSDKEHEKMIHMISKKTRHYAKRQGTFWRMLYKRLYQYLGDNRVETVNLSQVNEEEYCKKLAQELCGEKTL